MNLVFTYVKFEIKKKTIKFLETTTSHCGLVSISTLLLGVLLTKIYLIL